MVCSPGGTTIAGVHQLEKSGIRAALMDAVEAATNQAKFLSRHGDSKKWTSHYCEFVSDKLVDNLTFIRIHSAVNVITSMVSVVTRADNDLKFF